MCFLCVLFKQWANLFNKVFFSDTGNMIHDLHSLKRKERKKFVFSNNFSHKKKDYSKYCSHQVRNERRSDHSLTFANNAKENSNSKRNGINLS